ncbi:MAG: TonB C-terminal domain-containing protein [Sulfuricurvum sp.]|nr:TonB C-terminal domain-containing protein [Sulfuricurvum sp.]
MNLHYQRFFLQSGIITFLILGLILSFFIGGLLKTSKPDAFAMTKSDVISISLEDKPSLVSTKASQHSVPSAPEPVIEPKSVEKNPAEENEVKPVVPEINDLFASVKVSKTKPKTPDNTRQLSELNALEKKILETNRDSKIFDKVKTLDLAKSGVKMMTLSSGPAVNEYNAKIQGVIYANFHPASGTEGYAARVRISLSPDGRLLAYRVISYSGNTVFNAEVDWLKERLRQVGLPPHPQGLEAVFEIILTAKE